MQAKEFLVSRIAEEARRRHVGLSELERKLLFFSEVSPTLPDMMEVHERFEEEYDDAKYEAKIKKLSRSAFERDRREQPQNVERWREAIKVLKKEDHYLLVLLDIPRSASDRVKLVIAGAVATAAMVGAVAAIEWAGEHIHLRVPGYVELPALVFAFAMLYYLALSKTGTRLGNSFGELVVRVIRWF